MDKSDSSCCSTRLTCTVIALPIAANHRDLTRHAIAVTAFAADDAVDTGGREGVRFAHGHDRAGPHGAVRLFHPVPVRRLAVGREHAHLVAVRILDDPVAEVHGGVVGQRERDLGAELEGRRGRGAPWRGCGVRSWFQSR